MEIDRPTTGKEIISIEMASGLQVYLASDTLEFKELLTHALDSISKLNHEKERKATGVN